MENEICKGSRCGHCFSTEPPYTCIYCGDSPSQTGWEILIKQARGVRDLAREERDTARSERDEARAKRDQTVESLAFVNGQLDTALRGRNDALTQLAVAIRELDEVNRLAVTSVDGGAVDYKALYEDTKYERDTAKNERDQARRERDVIITCAIAQRGKHE